MPPTRTARAFAVIALILTAILSPNPHVHRTDRPVNYTLASHTTHTFGEPPATYYQFTAPSHAPSTCSPFQLPTFITAQPCETLLPTASEVTQAAASASPDRLSRFQLPPPKLQA